MGVEFYVICILCVIIIALIILCHQVLDDMLNAKKESEIERRALLVELQEAHREIRRTRKMIIDQSTIFKDTRKRVKEVKPIVRKTRI